MGVEVGQAVFQAGFDQRHGRVPRLGTRDGLILVAQQRKVGDQHKADEASDEDGEHQGEAALLVQFETIDFHVPCLRMTMRAVWTDSVLMLLPKMDREQIQEIFTTLAVAGVAAG